MRYHLLLLSCSENPSLYGVFLWLPVYSPSRRKMSLELVQFCTWNFWNVTGVDTESSDNHGGVPKKVTFSSCLNLGLTFIYLVRNTMPKDGNQTSACPMWPDQPAQCATILRLKYAFSTISLLACFIVLFLIWLFRHHKNGVQRLILFLTISACALSFGFVLGDYHTAGGGCTFQGSLR